MKKNILFTFCFSFIPGAGHMYQGYMKKGVSLMLLFALVVGLMAMVPIPLFSIPLPIIFAYSFFDTYSIRNKIGTDKEEKDNYIWENTDFDNILKKLDIKKKNTTLGIVLIVIGAYILLNTVLYNLAIRFDIYLISNLIDSITEYLVPIVISGLCIAVGVKFIGKK